MDPQAQGDGHNETQVSFVETLFSQIYRFYINLKHYLRFRLRLSRDSLLHLAISTLFFLIREYFLFYPIHYFVVAVSRHSLLSYL